ncbi:MAG: hypothetical protein N2Z85_01800 [Patescibacteria group bacterium]|nr:hypothetical protein [Patescibacteria group bacterium]
MEDLFIKKKASTEIMIPLDKDYTQWGRKLIKYLLTNYPILENLIEGINWRIQKFEQGTAIGTIVLKNKTHIPVIVEEYQCYPLDTLIISNDKFLPLNTENLREYLENPSAFYGISKNTLRFNLDLFTDRVPQFSPTGGNYIKTSQLSFIDNISNVDKETLKEFFTKLKNNPEAIENFEKNGTSFIIEKIANKKTISVESEIESFLRKLPIDRQYVYEDELGNVFLKQANSKIDYSWTININNIPYQFEILTEKKEYIPKKEKEIEVETDNLIIGNIEFQPIEVIDYSNIEKIAHFKIDENNDLVIKNGLIRESEPEINSFGTFIIPESGKALYPFTILEMHKEAGLKYYPEEELTVQQGVDTKVLKLTQIENKDFIEGTYIPKNAVFVKLGNNDYNILKLDKSIVKVIHGMCGLEKVSFYIKNDCYKLEKIGKNEYIVPENYKIKIAKKIKKLGHVSNSERVVGRDLSGHYFFKGAEFNEWSKYHQISNLKRDDAIWDLIHLGACKEDILKVARLEPGEYFKLNNPIKTPERLDKLEKYIQEKYAELRKNIPEIKDLIYETSFLKDAASVDAILSLNLMKRFNILEYINLLPDYERVLNELTKLLIISRLNDNIVPSNIVKTCVENLDLIIRLLKKLESVIKK